MENMEQVTDFRNVILVGDVVEQLKRLPDGIVQCVVTSPPYWGLRDYQAEGQIGLEKTVEEFIEKMVRVFNAVRRVLRDDGTLFLNLGDTYVQKQLIGVPWRVALALQADGWFLRSEIIWWKRNPMPESTKDRPTAAHEHLFLLTKNRNYFYDQFAVRQELSESFKNDSRWKTGSNGGNIKQGYEENGAENPKAPHRMFAKEMPTGSNLRSVWDIPAKGYEGAHFATFPPELPERCIRLGTSEAGACGCMEPLKRVTAPSERYAKVLGEGYHDHADDIGAGQKQMRGENKQNKMRDAGIPAAEYETMGWERTCGKALKQSVEKELVRTIKAAKQNVHDDRDKQEGLTGDRGSNFARDGFVPGMAYKCETTGFKNDCEHSAGTIVPCIVMDPFMGSGTTAEVAKRLGRDFIGIELNRKYVDENIIPRMEKVMPLMGAPRIL
jgi:DNA modification methylase